MPHTRHKTLLCALKPQCLDDVADVAGKGRYSPDRAVDGAEDYGESPGRRTPRKKGVMSPEEKLEAARDRKYRVSVMGDCGLGSRGLKVGGWGLKVEVYKNKPEAACDLGLRA